MPEPKSGMGHDYEEQWGIVMAGGEAVQNFTDYQARFKEFLTGYISIPQGDSYHKVGFGLESFHVAHLSPNSAQTDLGTGR